MKHSPQAKAEQYASSQYDVNQYTEPDSLKGTGWTDCRDAYLAGYEAATAELETLMREEACKFSEWVEKKYWRLPKTNLYTPNLSNGTIPIHQFTTAELYDQFKNQQNKE